MPSPLDLALSVVGDRWTLQVVDALLGGPLRFSELQEAVPAVASNLLTDRLRRLEAGGLVLASPYSSRADRLIYELAEPGRELADVVRLLAAWGARTGATADEATAAAGPRHTPCGTPLEVRWYCPTCDRMADEVDDGLRWL